MNNIITLSLSTLFIAFPILLSLLLAPETDITSPTPPHHRHHGQHSTTCDTKTHTTDHRNDGDELFSTKFSVFLQPFSDDVEENVVLESDRGLEYDFYRDSCRLAEEIIKSEVERIYNDHHNVTAAFLRLLFHDCFIKGCDASVFLNDTDGNKSMIERQAIPNLSLRGFDEIGQIKVELELACPGVVSCADTVAIATRDAVLRVGGPYYPVLTGRRDSNESYYDDAMTNIPKPIDDINRTLEHFSLRGFNEREIVSLLGGHNIGKINCDLILSRLDNFNDTGKPDPSVSSNFSDEIRHHCLNTSGDSHERKFFQGLSVSVPMGSHFDAHYYQNLVRGRGLLYSDQQLMAVERTASVVRLYASDDGSIFRKDFARAMVKMSNLGVLIGAQGQVRTLCDVPVNTFS